MPKNFVVIGASRGIGEAIVKLLAQNKTNSVFAFSRNEEKMLTAFNGLKNVHVHSLDLNDPNCFGHLSNVVRTIGNVDFMINNAGTLINKAFHELTHKDLTESYQVNVIGVIQSVQAVLPFMNKSHIVNISSMGGFQGTMKFPGLAAYSTSKAALCSFTELFAEEYKETEVKMNCLCLGAVQTEMLEEAFPGYKALLQPEEMAEYIVDFTINGGRFMNGKIIPVSLTTP